MSDAAIKRVSASAFTIPTDAPEADGTYAWNSTTLVIGQVEAGGKTGIGYSYTDAAACTIISGALAEAVVGLDAFRIPLATKPCYGASAISAAPGLSRQP